MESIEVFKPKAGPLGIIGRVSNVYRDKPWLARYRAGQPDSIAPEYGTMLEAFQVPSTPGRLPLLRQASESAS